MADALHRWRGAVLPLALLVAWSGLAHSGLVTSSLLVPIERVVLAPFVDPDGVNLWSALGLSVLRLLAGFTIGSLLGIGFGLLLGLSQLARGALAPSFDAVRQIALFAWIPLLTGWFGNGEGSKLVYIALSAFFPTALNSFDGLRGISVRHVETAAALRLSLRSRILRLYLPAALPGIVLGLQVALITAWIGTVGVEYAVGNGRGLGNFLSGGRELFRMDLVLAGVAMLSLVGFGLHCLMQRTLRRLFPWRQASV